MIDDLLQDRLQGGQSLYAVLGVATLIEVFVSLTLRATRDCLLSAALAAPPVLALTHFSALLAMEEPLKELLGSELTTFASIEQLQLMGLVWPDRWALGAQSQANWSQSNPSTQLSDKGWGRGKGQSSQRSSEGAGPHS